MNSKSKSFGTAPVFFTAISTILGTILFLQFGYAVGTTGFWGVLGIILLGHLVTIPTPLSISEIATNKLVEGGGEWRPSVICISEDSFQRNTAFKLRNLTGLRTRSRGLPV